MSMSATKLTQQYDDSGRSVSGRKCHVSALTLYIKGIAFAAMRSLSLKMSKNDCLIIIIIIACYSEVLTTKNCMQYYRNN